MAAAELVFESESAALLSRKNSSPDLAFRILTQHLQQPINSKLSTQLLSSR